VHRSVHKLGVKHVDRARWRAVSLADCHFLSASGSDERRLLIIRQDLRDRGSVARGSLGITGRSGVADTFTPVAAASQVGQQADGPPVTVGAGRLR
jgi:hypothetical protein